MPQIELPIPENLSKAELAKFFEENNICTFEDLLKATQIGDWGKFTKLNYLACHLGARDESGWTLMHWAVAMNNGQNIVRILLTDKNVSLEAKNDKGETPLHLAAHNGCDGAVTLLLEAGADLEARDNEGETPLCAAVRFNTLSMVRLLLEKGANHEITHAEKTLVQVARENGKREIAELIENIKLKETIIKLKETIKQNNKRIKQLEEQLSQMSPAMLAPPNKQLSFSGDSFFSKATEVKQPVSDVFTPSAVPAV